MGKRFFRRFEPETNFTGKGKDKKVKKQSVMSNKDKFEDANEEEASDKNREVTKHSRQRFMQEEDEEENKQKQKWRIRIKKRDVEEDEKKNAPHREK